MNKEQIKQEIQEAEERLKALREKMDAPGWEDGDVFADMAGEIFMQCERGQAYFSGGYDIFPLQKRPADTDKRLGTFEEVFMRRDEVRQAVEDILSTGDRTGDTLNDCYQHPDAFGFGGVQRVVDKLKALTGNVRF